MDEIELKLHDMSSTLQPVDAYALVLEEVNGNRKLPVIIGSLEAKAIRIKMLNYKLPRPWTHDLFLSLTRELGVTLKKILIYKVEDGIYYSYLFFLFHFVNKLVVFDTSFLCLQVEHFLYSVIVSVKIPFFSYLVAVRSSV